MNNLNRLKFLRIAICTGLLVGIFFSFELWFPIERTFPRAPMLIESPVWFERILSVILIVCLMSAMFFQKTKIFLITAICSLGLLVFFDQMRLQPWVYQYILLFAVIIFAETDDDKTLGLVQILLAALYFWSGLQKLNYTFSHETLPKLFENLFPEIQLPYLFIGISAALIEIMIGTGLVFRKTRTIAVFAAIITHTAILILLVAINYNSIVWIWNIALIFLIFTAFWNSGISLRQTFQKTTDRKIKFVKTVVAASVLLPVLSFFGLWDMYLSGALYSGNAELAVIRIDEKSSGKLPLTAQKTIFQTKKDGEKILPLFEWSLAELNVPVYPEKRIFRQIFYKVCKLSDNNDSIELIIKKRPAIFDGSYQIDRNGCRQAQ